MHYLLPIHNCIQNSTLLQFQVLVDYNEEFDILLTVKDESGHTLGNADSLSFKAEMSDDSLAKFRDEEFFTPYIPTTAGSLPGKRELITTRPVQYLYYDPIQHILYFLDLSCLQTFFHFLFFGANF